MTSDLTSFVGRRAELREIRSLLSSGRLVTLTGTGGVGKTRLAWRVAEEVRPAYPDGVHIVELAALHRPELLPRTVFGAFDLLDSYEDSASRLAEYLAHKRVLLVLDGCEHLAQACAEFVGTLLVLAPAVRVLTTSRHVLGVDGEQVFTVPPWDVPEVADLDAAVGLDAVRLFADRAAATAGFHVDEANWTEVVRICRRLEGIPLAIELAAVWLRTQTIRQVVDRLGNRVHGQALAGTIGRSFALCSPLQQLLWTRLSVFAGGFDLRAAEAVCSGAGIEAADVLELLAGLVDHSVVHHERVVRMMRYRMLDVIRRYGLDRLRESGAEPLVRRRHRDHYLSLAEEGEREWPLGSTQPGIARRTRLEHANLRAALQFSLGTAGHHAIGLHMAAALHNYWLNCGSLAEGRFWLGWALALNPEPSAERAKALWVSAYALIVAGDSTGGDLVDESLRWAREHHDDNMLGNALFVSGGNRMLRGDIATGLAEYSEAITLLSGEEDMSNAITSRSASAMCHAFLGELDQAVTLAQEALELCDERGELWCRSYARYALALARWSRGEHEQAKNDLREGLQVAGQFTNVLAAAMQIELLAWVLAANAEHERAAEVLGVADRVWPFVGGNAMLDSQLWIRPHEACVEDVRAAMGDDRFAAAFRRGATTAHDFDHAIALVLSDPTTPPRAPVPRPAQRALLSRREQQVAELVAEGLTNKEIATRLVIAQRTAETHVDHVLGKLGFTSRTQIATWVVEQRRP